MWLLDKQSYRIILVYNSWECVVRERFGEREEEDIKMFVAVERSLQTELDRNIGQKKTGQDAYSESIY